MENSQESMQHSTDLKTDLSKYNLSNLRAQQGSANRKTVHRPKPMSESLKGFLNRSEKQIEVRVLKKEFSNLFLYFSANFYGYGKHYVVDDENRKYVLELLSYFSKSEKFGSQGVVKNTCSLEKGLFVFGPCGCGKSDLFEIFRRMGFYLAKYGHMQMYFKGYTAKDIVANKIEFSKKLNERDPSIRKINIETGNIYLDDVGTEPKFFSQELISDYLQQRYSKEKENPYRTFITSNSSVSELSARYGIQVEDRFREMFNIIKWEGDSRRS
ncbi:hypothetical protein [Flavicella sp.]|uniref:hypothetical protein n=1 Tax=Flavicella sp. TaxID=2957742 RepID=UPI00262FD13D|nr:hypothetical protein [Flavicella sp.]MDG1805915.1 hypothetical protein [Flavicella sp.]